ncbi:RNA ligase [Bacillus phage Bastille]|uniref:RNA ligase n=2 Tax=Bastillevirus TaxID=1918010 RepID=A0A223LG80_9CAUD|nr:RNA ligase [Bacillus phage Bastille]AEQ34382.1 putative RNA ligase [Bacillus phage Bastille]ASU01102.1 RNA ligase [Bacillus phage Anthony]
MTGFEQKKYTKVLRYGKKGTAGLLTPETEIVILEKVDGSNASFGNDTELDRLRKFSRNNELTDVYGLNGFVEWADKTINPNELLPDVLYFGEWLAPHKVQYPEYTRTFVLFDLFDTVTRTYASFDDVEAEAKRLNLKLVPVLYRGKYISYEHLESFVGQTQMGGIIGDKKGGEGIVVKLASNDNSVFLKLVDEAFLEVHNKGGNSQQKAPKDPNKVSEERKFVNNTVTKARVDKIIYKLQDEGKLPEEITIQDMGLILSLAGRLVYDDIIEEERDMLPEEFEPKEVRRAIGGVLPNIVKEILKERGTY